MGTRGGDVDPNLHQFLADRRAFPRARSPTSSTGRAACSASRAPATTCARCSKRGPAATPARRSPSTCFATASQGDARACGGARPARRARVHGRHRRARGARSAPQTLAQLRVLGRVLDAGSTRTRAGTATDASRTRARACRARRPHQRGARDRARDGARRVRSLKNACPIPSISFRAAAAPASRRSRSGSSARSTTAASASRSEAQSASTGGGRPRPRALDVLHPSHELARARPADPLRGRAAAHRERTARTTSSIR